MKYRIPKATLFYYPGRKSDGNSWEDAIRSLLAIDTKEILSDFWFKTTCDKEMIFDDFDIIADGIQIIQDDNSRNPVTLFRLPWKVFASTDDTAGFRMIAVTVSEIQVVETA